MKLIVGLGNPGEKYKNNRHNVGFMVVDNIITRYKAQVTGSPDKKLVTCYLLPATGDVLAKPQTFMNASGSAVKKLVTRYLVTSDSRKTSRGLTSYESLYIVHDDLDIPLGQYKIQKGKGPKVHYGVRSVEQALGTSDFWRVRVGVENRVPRVAQVPRVPRGEEYVLQDFTSKEQPIIADVIQQIIADLNGRF